jgi:hypothetical protein
MVKKIPMGSHMSELLFNTIPLSGTRHFPWQVNSAGQLK